MTTGDPGRGIFCVCVVSFYRLQRVNDREELYKMERGGEWLSRVCEQALCPVQVEDCSGLTEAGHGARLCLCALLPVYREASTRGLW